METTLETPFEAFLNQHDTAAWARARQSLSSSIHEVDRNATQIWFHFFPLKLAQAFARTDTPEKLERDLRLNGNFRLAGQHGTSHWFLYGHRYWSHVRSAIVTRAESAAAGSSLDLEAIVGDVAADAARAAGADESLLIGISAVGLMTLQQVGLATFAASPASVRVSPLQAGRTPAQIVEARRRNDSQGIPGLWRGIKRRYTVTFDERRADGTLPAINQQHLTTAAANDTRDYSSGPRTCIEGPIPVECRTASCGTCWVGILGGAGKLSDVDALESRRIKEFGYLTSSDPKPIIRLACAAAASGNVTIVIPPWNGFIGKAGLGNQGG
jgi:ferredoxin